jgi:hypothetical protein
MKNKIKYIRYLSAIALIGFMLVLSVSSVMALGGFGFSNRAIGLGGFGDGFRYRSRTIGLGGFGDGFGGPGLFSGGYGGGIGGGYGGYGGCGTMVTDAGIQGPCTGSCINYAMLSKLVPYAVPFSTPGTNPCSPCGAGV